MTLSHEERILGSNLMGGIRVLFASLCLAGPTLLAATTPAHACSCGQMTLAEHVAGAEVIAYGTVSNGRQLRFNVEGNQNWIVWTVSVTEYLKGEGPADLDHIAPAEGAMCQISGLVGDDQLLMLSQRIHGYYWSSSCGGSQQLHEAQEAANTATIEEIRAILAAPPPVDGLPDTGAGPPDGGSSALSLGASAAIGSALAGAILLSPLAWRALRR